MEPERADERFESAVHAYWGSIFDQFGWAWTYAPADERAFCLAERVYVQVVGSDDPEGRDFQVAARRAFSQARPGSLLLVGRQALYEDRRRRMYLGRLWRDGRAFTRVFDPAFVYEDPARGNVGLRQERLAGDLLSDGHYDPVTCSDDFAERFLDLQQRAKRIIWWRTPTPTPLGALLDR